jgi:hypothetical protein
MKRIYPRLQMGAEFGGPNEEYRYALDRIWGDGQRIINFVMLNPSTADAFDNDPTVTRCMERTHALGCDGLVVTNLFAYRSTDPAALRKVPDPIGPSNDEVIAYHARKAALVVCGWGALGSLYGRSGAVLGLLKSIGVNPHYLRLTAGGEPGHPLYLPYDLVPRPMG